MTSATRATTPVRIELDEHGKLRPFTAEQCLAVLTEWAERFPAARFMVAAMAPDGSDAVVLGWGLALPDHVFVHLPVLDLTHRFRTADDLIRPLRRTIDARLIWVDPEPDRWPDEPDG